MPTASSVFGNGDLGHWKTNATKHKQNNQNNQNPSTWHIGYRTIWARTASLRVLQEATCFQLASSIMYNCLSALYRTPRGNSEEPRLVWHLAAARPRLRGDIVQRAPATSGTPATWRALVFFRTSSGLESKPGRQKEQHGVVFWTCSENGTKHAGGGGRTMGTQVTVTLVLAACPPTR